MLVDPAGSALLPLQLRALTVSRLEKRKRGAQSFTSSAVQEYLCVNKRSPTPVLLEGIARQISENRAVSLAAGRLRFGDVCGIETVIYRGMNEKNSPNIWMQRKSGIYLQLEICNYRSARIVFALFVFIHKDSKLKHMTDEQLGKRNPSARFPACRIRQNRFRITSEWG